MVLSEVYSKEDKETTKQWEAPHEEDAQVCSSYCHYQWIPQWSAYIQVSVNIKQNWGRIMWILWQVESLTNQEQMLTAREEKWILTELDDRIATLSCTGMLKTSYMLSTYLCSRMSDSSMVMVVREAKLQIRGNMELLKERFAISRIAGRLVLLLRCIRTLRMRITRLRRAMKKPE